MLDWLLELHETSPVGHAIGLVALVGALGMALGSIKAKGIGLGSSGVLFVGILAAQFSESVDARTLTFIKEFGLVLFVFTIGLQLGPGFFASMRADGVRLNLLAAVLVVSAGVLAPLLGWAVGLDPAAVAGLFAGASTNTPALGAAQQSLATMPDMSAERLALPALACAVSYPGAIVGSLGVILALKIVFRIDPVREAQSYAAERRKSIEPLVRRTIVVESPPLAGTTIDEARRRVDERIVVSRIRRAGESEVQTAHGATKLAVGDAILAVGTAPLLARFAALVGRPSNEDLMAAPGQVTFRRIAVTHRRALGKTIGELGLEAHLGVQVTRIMRGDVELTAVPSLRLAFGDVLQIVGTEHQLDRAAQFLGNSLQKLNETQFIPLFAGIFWACSSARFRWPCRAWPVRCGWGWRAVR